MKLILLGNPIAKARARAFPRGKHIMFYDPQTGLKNEVRDQFCRFVSESVEASEIAKATAFTVEWYFYLPVAGSVSASQRNAKLWGFDLPNHKPDYDNLEKFYLDCANGILWRDDAMVIDAGAHKIYSSQPRIEVNIMEKKPVQTSASVEKIICSFSPDELKAFLCDVKLIAIYITQPDDVVDDNMGRWMDSTAKCLSKFSMKYANILKKIEKVGEINE